jgi:hypothetical protein
MYRNESYGIFRMRAPGPEQLEGFSKKASDSISTLTLYDYD